MKTSEIGSFLFINARWLAAGFLLLFASTFGQTLFIGLSGGEIREAYGLSSGEFGTLYMLVTLSSAVVLSLLGAVLDKRSLRTIVAWSVAALALGAALVGFSEKLAVLVIGLFLLRLFGQGMMIHSAFTAIGRWFRKSRGRATAITVLGFNAGEAALPIMFVLAATLVGWQTTWILIAAFLVLVILPIVTLLVGIDRVANDKEVDACVGSERQWTRSEVLRDPSFYLLNLGLLAPVTIASSIFFHQAVLTQSRDWSPEVFPASISVYAVVAVIAVLVAGALIDRAGPLLVLPFHLLPLALGCWVLAFSQEPWAMFVFMGLYAITEPFSLALVGTIWPHVYGTKHLGAIRAAYAAALTVFTALGPGFAGVQIDLGITLDMQIAIMGWYCIGVMPLLFFAARMISKRSRDRSN